MPSQTLMATQAKEALMATQTRHIARRSTTFFRATGKYVIMACSGLVLLSAVAAHAGSITQWTD